MMFVTLAGFLAVVGTLAGSYYFALRPETLRIAVGPANSDDLKVVQALTQAFTQTHGQIRLRPQQTDGASASAQALADGKADLAIIRGDLEVPKNAQAVATLRKNVAVLWVPPAAKGKGKGKKAGPKITKISQLAGHRIGVVGRTPSNVNLLKIILQQYGVDPAKVEIVQFPGGEASEAIRGQRADAYLAAGPVNSKIIADAIAASTRDGGTPKFLAIDSAEAIAQNHPMYEASEIPAGVFGGRPDDEVKTISFSHHIVARRGVSDSAIAAFTRQLFAARRTVMAEFPLAAKIETPDTDKDAVIPVHPGAAAFVDGEEKSFLDRYSDYIWWALMALSAMGSAGAWFAGYMKKDERNDNSSLRERLLEMIAAARRSDSVEELDRMQADADNILHDTLNGFEHGAIEEGALTAFNIALEQFHNAVADRRALLTSLPQNLQRAGAQFRATGTL
jgi:TRAP transporter TAXI family solute receptor